MNFDIELLLTKGYLNEKLKVDFSKYSELSNLIPDLNENKRIWPNTPSGFANYSCYINNGSLELFFLKEKLLLFCLNIIFKIDEKKKRNYKSYYNNSELLELNHMELIEYLKKRKLKYVDTISKNNDVIFIKNPEVLIHFDLEEDFIAKISVSSKFEPYKSMTDNIVNFRG